MSVSRWAKCLLVVSVVTAAGAQERATDLPRLVVERNVRISTDGERPHVEMMIAANPVTANSLVSTTMVGQFQAPSLLFWSADGGRSWSESHIPTRYSIMPDPQVAFTANGTAIFLGLGRVPDRSINSGVVVGRSTDGGRSWQEVAVLPNGDHEQVVSDLTDGKYRGRIYYNVLRQNTDGSRGVYLFRSADDGLTWQGPVTVSPVDAQAGNALVLSDGAIFAVAHAPARPEWQTQRLDSARLVIRIRDAFAISTDGGESFGPLQLMPHVTTIAGEWARLQNVIGSSNYAVFAVNPASRWKDRIYVVNAEERGDVYRVMLSFSDDRGATWSPMRPIDATARRAVQYRPSIAVSHDGVVGVSWLDTRHSRGHEQYDLYFAASIDGGETFLPSVRVTERSSMRAGPGNARIRVSAEISGADTTVQRITAGNILNRHPHGGDYIGLAASTDGVFHPLWPDARTGVFQLYTARVRLERERLARPAALRSRDVTRHVRLVFDMSSYDTTSRTYDVAARLRNEGTDTLYGPITVEIKGMVPAGIGSAKGDARRRRPGNPRYSEDSTRFASSLLNASNGRRGIGAVYAFSAELGGDGYLLPGQESQPMLWKIKVPSAHHLPELKAAITAHARP